MNIKTLLLIIAALLVVLACVAAYQKSFLWYGMCMYFVGVIAGLFLPIIEDEQDDNPH